MKSWRRMYWRFDPRAMRRAISRERSAARAANTLPRLAHAASRMRPASSINPAMKARAGRPSVSPTSPGRARENLSSSSSFGFDLASEAPRIFRSDAAEAGVTPGFKWPTIQVKWSPRSSTGSHPAICGMSRMGAHRSGAKKSSVPRKAGGATPTMV